MSEELKPHVVKSHDIRLDSDYVSWVHDVKQRYVSAQIKSAVKVKIQSSFSLTGSWGGIWLREKQRRNGEKELWSSLVLICRMNFLKRKDFQQEIFGI